MNHFRSLRVLVVDAAQSMAQALSFILKENGYDAASAINGAEALALCSQNWPDVVIIGKLPEPQEGAELAIQVMNGHPECRVLRISEDEHGSTRSQDPDSIDRSSLVFAKTINSRSILEYLRNIQGTTGKRAAVLRH